MSDAKSEEVFSFQAVSFMIYLHIRSVLDFRLFRFEMCSLILCGFRFGVANIWDLSAEIDRERRSFRSGIICLPRTRSLDTHLRFTAVKEPKVKKQLP